ncbi:MAG: PepSY domain-containing protein [Candidatus Saccharimonadales bacterium]
MNVKKSFIIPGVIGLAGLSAAGGSLLNSASSYADTTATNSSQTTAASSNQGQIDTTQPPQQDWSKGGHQANNKTETVLTGDDLSKATAAAQAAVSGGTVLRAETDADGEGTYEVHMKKSDGSLTTVFLDANFKVTSTENGMGTMSTPPQNSSQTLTTSTTQND